MVLESKKNLVHQLQEIYNNNCNILVFHYQGLTVNSLDKLRSELRQDEIKLKVVKNTLASIAADNTKVEEIKNLFSGPVALVYGNNSVPAAKALVNFAKDHEKLKILGGLIDSSVVDANDVEHIAKLPSLEELKGKIVGLLQAPASKMLRTISAPGTQLARVVEAYSKK